MSLTASLPAENEWKSLETQPIVETVASAVPTVDFVSYPTQGIGERIISGKTPLPAAGGHTALLNRLTAAVEVIDNFLVSAYGDRGISKVVQGYLDQIRDQETKMLPPEWQSNEAKELAKGLLIPRLYSLNGVMENVTNASKSVADEIIKNMPFWTSGQFSEEVLDKLALYIYRMVALEQVAPATSVNNDIAFLKRLANDVLTEPQDKTIAGKVQVWMASPNAATNGLLGECKSMGYEDLQTLFNVLFPYISKKIVNNDFFDAEMLFAYINLAIFLIKLYEQQRKEEYNREYKAIETKNREKADKKNRKRKKPVDPKPVDPKKLKKRLKFKPLSNEIRYFVKILVEAYPVMPLYFEVAGETKMNVPEGVTALTEQEIKKLSVKAVIEVPPFETLLATSRKLFSSLSQLVSQMLTVPDKKVLPKYAERLYSLLPTVLTHNSTVLSRIRQFHVYNLTHPPPAPEPKEGSDEEAKEKKKMSAYECSMKMGLKPEDLRMFLLLLYISRSTKELIDTHFPLIYAHLCWYCQKSMQQLAWNTIPVVVAKNASSKNPAINDQLKCIRSLVGRFKEGELAIETNAKKFGKLPFTTPECPPHQELVELARMQIQLMTNQGSEPLKGKKHLLAWLAESKHFVKLLNLKTTVLSVFDQSNLYFRENALSVSGKTFFPVTSSFPVLLSNFAMENYQEPELTTAIFYPLSIYDDAASTALRVLKSRLLYEEIKAESRICLLTVTKLIADSAFHPLRKFALMRLISRGMGKKLAEDEEIGAKSFAETASAVRLGVVLQQNQLHLLGCPIDTKSMITDRLNDLMSQEVCKAVSLTAEHGALVAIALGKLLEVLKNTNKIFESFSLPMMSFENQLTHALATYNPASLHSQLLRYVSDHLSDVVVPHYYLMTNPLRIIPSTKPNIRFRKLFTRNAGVIFEKMVLPTTAFISVESFRELFWLMDDGTIPILHNEMISAIPELFDSFLVMYKNVAARLKRIKEPPITMSCSQVFDRYEGAYRYFVQDQNMTQLFAIMAQIGNIIGISEMMDDAMGLKVSAAQQVSALLMGQNPHEPPSNPELYGIFDRQFQQVQSMMTHAYPIPGENEVVQPLLFNVLEVVVQLIRQNEQVFDETSPNLLDVTTTTGFASVWGIMEFLFVLMEISRTPDGQGEGQIGSISKYGEGVLLCAAAILCACSQRPLYRLLSIGERIKAHQMTDFETVKDDAAKRALAVNGMVTASMACAMSNVQTAIEKILGH